MIYDPLQPLNPHNVAVQQYAERQFAIDNVSAYLIDLYLDDVDINDDKVQSQVLRYYDLEDLTEQEAEIIRRRVEKALN